jgi:hypothetical protein
MALASAIASLSLCIVCSGVLGTGMYAIISGNWMPENAPVSIKYSALSDSRLIGTPTLAKYEDISEDQCINRCSLNNGCMSVTYKEKDRKCNLYKLNSTIDPRSLSDEWPGTTLYEKRYFWGRFDDAKQGYMEDVAGVDKKSKKDSVRDCANACFLQFQNPECVAFNYNESTKDCELLGIGIKGNEYAFNTKATGEVYELKEYTIDKRNIIQRDEEDNKNSSEAFVTSVRSVRSVPYDNRFCYDKRFLIIILLLAGVFIFKNTKL